MPVPTFIIGIGHLQLHLQGLGQIPNPTCLGTDFDHQTVGIDGNQPIVNRLRNRWELAKAMDARIGIINTADRIEFS